MLDRLERAAAALGDGNRELAITELVVAWRQSRIPEVADLVDEVAAIAPSLALGQKVPLKLEAYGPWLRELMLTDDPRAATRCHQLLLAPPFVTRPGWDAIFPVVVQLRDPRSVAVLAEVRDKLTGLVPPSQYSAIARERSAVHKKLIQRYPVLPTPPPETRAALEALRQQLSKLQTATLANAQPGADLLAAIREHPADDGPRLIFADWLQQRGDPRGELLALQLSGTRDARTLAREQTLIRHHGGTWLGPIADIAVQKSWRFERGFPVAIAIKTRNPDRFAAVSGAPQWWSIEEIELVSTLDSWPAQVALLADPALTSLVTVRGLDMSLAHRLASSRRPLAISTLGLRVTTSDWLSDAGPGMPHLAHLELVPPALGACAAGIAGLLTRPIASQLQSISIVRDKVTLRLERGFSRLVIDGTRGPLDERVVGDLNVLIALPLTTTELFVTPERHDAAIAAVRALPNLVVTVGHARPAHPVRLVRT